jgi:hypothetical protein
MEKCISKGNVLKVSIGSGLLALVLVIPSMVCAQVSQTTEVTATYSDMETSHAAAYATARGNALGSMTVQCRNAGPENEHWKLVKFSVESEQDSPPSPNGGSVIVQITMNGTCRSFPSGN